LGKTGQTKIKLVVLVGKKELHRFEKKTAEDRSIWRTVRDCDKPVSRADN